MGIDKFEISLSNPPNHVYTPGDTVAGTITLQSSPDVDLKDGISIILYGFAFVSWTEHHGRTSVVYVGNEELFKKSVVQHVNAEQTEYPFMMQIPSIPSLPWTVTTKNGRVQYGVNAIIKRPWFKLGDKKAKLQFTLKSHLNERIADHSRNQPYYQSLKPVNSDEVSAGCCCFPFCCWYVCSEKVVKVTLSVLSLWAYPGDKLPFTLEVDNTLTERQLGNVKIQLVGTWFETATQSGVLFDGSDKILSEESVFAEEIHETGGVKPGELKMNIGKIEIPQNIKPTQVECSIIVFKYKLKAIMDEISGFRCCGGPATAEVDIVIGTKEDIGDPMNPHAVVF